MVIVKFYGDEWQLEEKIVCALKAGTTFASSLALIIGKLGAESFNGLCFYRTEGRPPNYIRPTIPISINSTPQREKMMDGTVIYVKAADLRRQELDIQFQESLENFRREKGLKGVAPDGSDVEQFKEWIASNLNVKEAKEIDEHEGSDRSKIEVLEFRGWRDITVNERDKMKLNDDESEGRSGAWEGYLEVVTRLFHEMITVPLSQERLIHMNHEEATARAELERGLLDGDYRELQTEERAERRAAQKVVDARLAAERKVEAEQRRKEEERQALERAEAARKRQHELEAKERELEMLEELRKQQQGWADPEQVQAMVDEAVENSSREMAHRIAAEVEKVTGGLKDFVEGHMHESKRRFDELLAYLMPFHNAAVSASFGTQLTHNQVLVDLYEEHVKELGKQIDKRVETVKIAVDIHKQREAAAEEDCKLLVAEQEKLIGALQSKDEEERDMRDLEERMLEAEERREMDTLYESILGSRTLLDAIALEHQRRSVLEGSKVMATTENYRRLLAQRVAEMERAAHPNARLLDRFLYGGAIPLDRSQRRTAQRETEEELAQLPLHEREARVLERELLDTQINAQQVDVEAQAIIFVYAERHGLPAEEVAAMLDKYQCAWRVADELIYRVRTPTSNQFIFARKYVEEHSPNLRPVLDLLLDVYRGREVELIAAIYTSNMQSSEVAAKNRLIEATRSGYGSEKQQQDASPDSPLVDENDWSRAECYVEGKEGEGPLERSFYYHKNLESSQWLPPRCWEAPSSSPRDPQL